NPGVYHEDHPTAQTATPQLPRRTQEGSRPDASRWPFRPLRGPEPRPPPHLPAVPLESRVPRPGRSSGLGPGDAGAATPRATAPHRAGARHLKKSLGHFQPDNLKEVYPVIGQLEKEGFPVAAVCQTLGVSRAGYYAQAHGGVSLRQEEDARLALLIRQIFWEHKRRYGARRIAAELAARGESCGPGRVGRLLQQLGLQAI